jgi:hypothetical protein
MEANKVNKGNWKIKIVDAFEGLFSITFGSTIFAWMANSFGLLKLKITIDQWEQYCSFMLVWMFCCFGVLLWTDFTITKLKIRERIVIKEKRNEELN